jgi:hypothetical protein
MGARFWMASHSSRPSRLRVRPRVRAVEGLQPLPGLVRRWERVTRGCFAPRAIGFNASGVTELGMD